MKNHKKFMEAMNLRLKKLNDLKIWLEKKDFSTVIKRLNMQFEPAVTSDILSITIVDNSRMDLINLDNLPSFLILLNKLISDKHDSFVYQGLKSISNCYRAFKEVQLIRF